MKNLTQADVVRLFEDAGLTIDIRGSLRVTHKTGTFLFCHAPVPDYGPPARRSTQGNRQIKEQTHDFGDGNGPVPAHRHIKGGGWVADTANVHNSAYIGEDALVYGNALVYGDAWVSGNALVYGDAWVSGSARVYGNALVYGDAWVSGNARVRGDALVYGNALVYGDALVHDNALVYGNARVYGDAWVSGDAWVYGNALVKRGEYTSTPTSITRSDGYMFTLQSDGSIVAGCRDFTPDEAKAHWGNPEHHKHRESMAIISAFNAIQTARS